MKFFLFLVCFFAGFFSFSQEKSVRPKIGLTLSGGGAKGLAHIGILKAIDSAGLKVDYITGTSMGAIVGALYAVGYTGNDIERMQKEINWDILFSNNISLQALSMEEKEQYSRFAIELPYINNKIRLQTGVVNGQELNLKFLEFFFHVYNIRRFDQLKIPFKCMATDLETGNLIVLDSGDITSALRATMAIPSVFSAVTRDNMKLVDGGLVRNFPVKNVKDMGADIVIGSNVTNGLSKIEKIKNPVDVLLQMAFFKEAADFKEELPLLDIYIHMPMEKYNTGSFGSSKEILKIGDETGKNYYAQFKKLADSINALPAEIVKKEQPTPSKSVFITNYKVIGLKKTSAPFFAHLLNFYDYHSYTAIQLNKCIRRAYGSRYYGYITYSLEPVNKDTASIIFTVEENPGTYIKGGLYYTRFRGINLNINITSRDFIIPNSRSLVSISLGESLQLETEHLQFLGRIQNVAFAAGFRLDNMKINSYNNFLNDGSFKQNFVKGYLNFQTSGSNKITTGVGTSIDYISYNPVVKANKEFKGSLSYLRSYFFLKFNTLNQIFYPTKGLRLNTELGYVYNQQSNIKSYENGIQTPYIKFTNFFRLAFDGSIYSALGPKFNLFSEAQLGINFTSNPTVQNNFIIGGINGIFRNQIRFAGLPEASLNSSGVAAVQLGLRYSVINNLYVIGRINGLIKDFATTKHSTSASTFLTGYSLTFAYKTPIGPLELSAMYSDQSKKIESYVLFGIPF